MELKLRLCKARAAAPDKLLIVPYGIETKKHKAMAKPIWAFNRTLWN